MDFGTICNNLEKGVKYKNSEDVYKDVRYIWENCYKYNNKGDYIVELMKRVKKGFAKYWAAVGLYDQPQENSGNVMNFMFALPVWVIHLTCDCFPYNIIMILHFL